MVENLTKDTFLVKIFDYLNNSEWKFEGNKPAIIDFYADWCMPCRMVTPVIEELAKEYSGKLDIYKINTEKEQELAAAFGIKNIPSILFIPLQGQPQIAMGALPKEVLIEAIKDVLKVEFSVKKNDVGQNSSHDQI